MESLSVTELNYEGLRMVARYCEQAIGEHPAAYYILSRVCKRFMDEYDDQGIPVARFRIVNLLVPDINGILHNPEDIVKLNEFIRAASKIW